MATEGNVKRVFKLQKRAALVIPDADFGERSAEQLKELAAVEG